MAKGFGAIMASAAMAAAEARQKAHPACPLCGGDVFMEYNGVAWFCYHARREHSEWLDSRRSAAYEYQAGGGVVFWTDIETPPRFRRNNWDPGMQGVILAVTEDGWTFSTVRGAGGVTNFTVNSPRDRDGYRVENVSIPALADWQWAEWTGR